MIEQQAKAEISDGWCAAGLLCAALLLASGCSGSSGDSKTAATPDKKQGDRTFLVRTEKVSRQPVTYQLEAMGNLEAQDVFIIDARVPGTLEDVNFNEGDEVNQKTVLARISPTLYRVQLDKASASRQRAIADVEDAERRLKSSIERNQVTLDKSEVEIRRRRDIKDVGAYSVEELQVYQAQRDIAAVDKKDATEALRTQINVLKAAIQEREAEQRQAEDAFNKCIVVPPVAGRIEQRLVATGQYVTAGTHLATLLDPRPPKLKFTVSERESPAVTPGAQVQFMVSAYPGRRFSASVYRVSDQAETKSRLVTCFARLDPAQCADAVLKAGFYAAVSIVTEQKKAALVVPLTAVLPSEGGFVAYVVQNNKAVRRNVRPGLQVSAQNIELLEGVEEGEVLVVDGATALLDGVSVREPGQRPEKNPDASTPRATQDTDKPQMKNEAAKESTSAERNPKPKSQEVRP